MEAISQIAAWPARAAAAGAVTRKGVAGTYGDADATFRWASVTKPVTALTALVAVEEGTIELDEPAGPAGSTVRHLLAHASGLPLNEGPPIAEPGQRRIYSNQGFEVLARLVEARAEMPFAGYLDAAVLAPLGVPAQLRSSPAWGMEGSLRDLLAVAGELLSPTLVAPETLAEATEVQFPGLVGVLPGFGRQDPNDWGLGFELRGGKQPHWTGELNSPRTFGHFGASGTFLWVDPDAGVACACLSDAEFGDWAKEAWPRLSDAVLEELSLQA
ncbi:MAG: beta-lactamase family protein [Actinomycetota bacterium]|nr:beta-lactamase family protein [Actinomycetota bacterium]